MKRFTLGSQSRQSAGAARFSGAYEAVHQIDLDDLSASLPSPPFDVVLCGDVLEHLRDPAGSLRRLSQLLADHGRVIVSLPNVAHLSIRFALLLGRFRY